MPDFERATSSAVPREAALSLTDAATTTKKLDLPLHEVLSRLRELLSPERISSLAQALTGGENLRVFSYLTGELAPPEMQNLALEDWTLRRFKMAGEEARQFIARLKSCQAEAAAFRFLSELFTKGARVNRPEIVALRVALDGITLPAPLHNELKPKAEVALGQIIDNLGSLHWFYGELELYSQFVDPDFTATPERTAKVVASLVNDIRKRSLLWGVPSPQTFPALSDSVRTSPEVKRAVCEFLNDVHSHGDMDEFLAQFFRMGRDFRLCDTTEPASYLGLLDKAAAAAAEHGSACFLIATTEVNLPRACMKDPALADWRKNFAARMADAARTKVLTDLADATNTIDAFTHQVEGNGLEHFVKDYRSLIALVGEEMFGNSAELKAAIIKGLEGLLFKERISPWDLQKAETLLETVPDMARKEIAQSIQVKNLAGDAVIVVADLLTTLAQRTHFRNLPLRHQYWKKVVSTQDIAQGFRTRFELEGPIPPGLRRFPYPFPLNINEAHMAIMAYFGHRPKLTTGLNELAEQWTDLLRNVEYLYNHGYSVAAAALVEDFGAVCQHVIQHGVANRPKILGLLMHWRALCCDDVQTALPFYRQALFYRILGHYFVSPQIEESFNHLGAALAADGQEQLADEFCELGDIIGGLLKANESGDRGMAMNNWRRMCRAGFAEMRDDGRVNLNQHALLVKVSGDEASMMLQLHAISAKSETL